MSRKKFHDYFSLYIFLNFEAENHVTYFGHFVPYLGRTGKKTVHYFLNTQRIFMQQNADILPSFAANKY